MVAADGSWYVSAAIGSMTPQPVAAFGPTCGVCAVRLTRSITSAAESPGKRDRTRATTPETRSGKACAVDGRQRPCAPGNALINPAPVGLSEVIRSPGAATSTMARAMRNHWACHRASASRPSGHSR